MAPNRLYIDEILSIGLVGKGDNPESTVMLWKSRDLDKKHREPTLGEYRARLETIGKELRQWEEVDKIEHRKRGTNMPSTTPATDALIINIEKQRARDRGEKVADSFAEMVEKKLESWAARAQIRNEIAGKYGSLSTPRVDQRQLDFSAASTGLRSI